MEKKRTSLKNFVYRVLGKRILFATLAISAVLAAVIFAGRRDEVGDAALEISQNRIRILLARTWERADRERIEPVDAFRKELNSMRAARLTQKKGGFVLGYFTSPEGTVLVDFQEDGYGNLGEIKRYVAGKPRPSPGEEETWHEIVRFGGRPHVHLVTPMVNREGKVAAYAQAVFAVSDAAIAAARRDIAESILWVIAIVVVTAAILYPVILTLTKRLAKLSEDLLESHLETVQILGSAIAKRDSDTSAHNFRVTIMSVRIAEVIGLEPEKMQRLIKGAFLHDVGKIGITDNILLKPAKLDDEEFTVMKTHVNHGVDIVTRKEWLTEQLDGLQAHVEEGVKIVRQMSWLDEATQVVGGHHEKFDGSGYPHGLKGEEIPLVARIFAIADVFDALTCERPYKKPFSYEKSMEILEEGRGTHFDPRVLDTFKTLADELYRGLANREDKGLKDTLERITRQYFEAGLEILAY
jgi:HD-GYP domain-containing protein (c-di-GMP phosphodiesterase class II)